MTHYFSIINQKTLTVIHASAPERYPLQDEIIIEDIDTGEYSRENAIWTKMYIVRHWKSLQRVVWNEIVRNDIEGIPVNDTICGHDLYIE